PTTAEVGCRHSRPQDLDPRVEPDRQALVLPSDLCRKALPTIIQAIRLPLRGAVRTDRTSNVSRLDDGRPAGDLLHTPASVWLAVFGYHEVFHLLGVAGPPPTSWPSAGSLCSPGEQSMRDWRSATSSLVADPP